MYWEVFLLWEDNVWKRYLQDVMHRGWPPMLLVQWKNKETAGEMQGVEYAEEEGDEEDNEEDVDPDGARSSDYPTEPTGEADEGERIPSLIEQMQQDDLQADESLEYGISDDEDDASVPADWNNPNFNNLVVNEGNQVAWEYTQNEVTQGARYPTSQAMKDAVTQWATSL
jgi:hypothetical protein